MTSNSQGKASPTAWGVYAAMQPGEEGPTPLPLDLPDGEALHDPYCPTELFLERGGYAMAFSAGSEEAARAMAISS